MSRRSRISVLILGVAILAIIASSCSSPDTTPAAAAPAPSAAARRPADVTDYRGGLSRTGVMPGPGPGAAPVVLWRHKNQVPVTFPPVVVAGQVLVPGSSSLVALDLVTGATTWQVALGGTVIAPLTIAEGTVLATTADGVLHAIDLAPRREIWRFAGAADGAQASVHAGTVYLGTRQHEFVALDAMTGMRRWAVGVGSSANKNAIVGDFAYVGGDGGSTLAAINLVSRKILWSFDTHSDRIATPAVAGGTVFVAGVAAAGLTGRNTSLFALRASSGRLLWRFAPPGDPPMASFAVGQKDIFIGLDAPQGILYAVDRQTGRVHWQVRFDGAVDRPALVGNTVYVAAGEGGLHAFDVASGRPLWTAAVAGFSEGVALTGGIALIVGREAPDSPGTVTALISPRDPKASSRVLMK